MNLASNCTVHPNDPAFSWVTRAAKALNSMMQVPTAWAIAPDVLAISGDTTSQVISNQVPTMQTKLGSHAGSWNVVSVTGGADDLQFSNELAAFYLKNTLNNLHPWSITNSKKCLDTEGVWTTLQGQSASIATNLDSIASSALGSDPNVRLVDVNYPYVMDTSNICSIDRGAIHGAQSVIDGLDSLHGHFPGANVVNIDLRTGFGVSPLADLQLIELYGYPHPNDAGQTLIGNFAAQGVMQLNPSHIVNH